MKTIANILLVSIYAISSFGVGIKQFYCCGKLRSTNISYIQQVPKEKCAMGKCKSGCCKNKFSFYKLNSNHVAADYLTVPSKEAGVLANFFPFFVSNNLVFDQNKFAYNNHAPPPRHGVPVYILNCAYRI